MIVWNRARLVLVRLWVGLALCLPVAWCQASLLYGCPDNITTETDPGEGYATVEWHPPVIQNGTNMTTLTTATNHTPGDRFDIGRTPIMYTLHDAALQVDNCTFFIIVEDNEKPVFLRCPSNITINLTSTRAETVVTWQLPQISDNSGFYSLSSNHNSGEFFPIRDTTVHYIATDPYNNAATCEFNVKVIDSRRLEFSSCPTDITKTLQIDQSRVPVMWREPIILLEDRDFTVTSNHRPGELFDTGRTMVTYTAIDNLGSIGYCNFHVIVTRYPFSHFTRTIGSYLPGHDDRTLQYSSTVDCLLACIEEFAFVCKSVDIEGKKKCRLSRSTATSDMWGKLAKKGGSTHYERLMDDTTPVLIGCSQNITQPTEAGQDYATVSWMEPTVSDSDNPSLTASHASGSSFYLGVTKVVYTAADVDENVLTCDFFVTIEDKEVPIIIQCPKAIIKLTSDTEDTKASWEAPTASDNSGYAQLSSNHQPGDWFPPGSTVVTYSAQDKAGNRAECSFVVLVKNISDSNYISLRLLLDNFTYTDALQDKDSEEFQRVTATVEKNILSVFSDDDTILGVLTNQFRYDNDILVADVSVGFSEVLSPPDEHGRLNKILRAFLDGDLMNVAMVKVRQESDACTIMLCPASMNCTATGLQCTATCADNIKYCLNDGMCEINDNLVACACRSKNNMYLFSGNRCGVTRMSITGKQLTVIALGGLWFVIMISMLIAYLIAVKYKKRAKQGKAEAAAMKGSHPMHPLPEGTLSQSPLTSDDVGYSSRGEGEMSPPESDTELRVNLTDNLQEAAHQEEESRGGRDDTHSWDVRQDIHVPVSTTSSCSSCTCSSSSCTSTAESCSSSSSSDSGTEVIRFPSRGDFLETPLGGIISHVKTRPQMTVEVDVERSPSCLTRSYDGVIPDPIIESEIQSLASLVDTNSQMSAEVAVETTPLLSHFTHSYDGILPDPVVESDYIQTSPSASLVDTNPQMSAEVAVETTPHLTHSYDGILPDPVVESDMETSPSTYLVNTNPQMSAEVAVETTPLISHLAHSYDDILPDPVVESDMETSPSTYLVNTTPQMSPTVAFETTPLPSHFTHSYDGVNLDSVFEEEMPNIEATCTSNVDTNPQMSTSFSSHLKHSYNDVIPDPVLDSEIITGEATHTFFDDLNLLISSENNTTMADDIHEPSFSKESPSVTHPSVPDLLSTISCNDVNDITMTEEHFV